MCLPHGQRAYLYKLPQIATLEDFTLLDVRFYDGTHVLLTCEHGMFPTVEALFTNALLFPGQGGPEMTLRTRVCTITCIQCQRVGMRKKDTRSRFP